MAGNSLDSLLQWMTNPNNNIMWDWDSIAAMSRGKTNTLLLQEYIARFAGGSYLPPISGEVEVVKDEWKEYIHDYLLDAPRLSFENASLNGSKARLTCAIVGGSQLSMKYNLDIWQVVKVFEVDPLQGPKLLLDLDLAEVPGIVDDDGRVRLDLAKSDNFKLTFAETEHEQRLGGDFFKDLFNQLPDEKRVWVLGRIEGGGQSTLRPQSFKLRTQANGQASRDPLASDYGDGAILVFIQMVGSRAGGTPSDEYRYLIPDDAGKDYSATVLFEPDRLAAYLMTESIADIVNSHDFDYQYDPETGKFVSLKVRSGEFIVPESVHTTRYFWRPDQAWHDLDVTLEDIRLSADQDNPFSITVEADGRFSVSWDVSTVMVTRCEVPRLGEVVLEHKSGLNVSIQYVLEAAEEGPVFKRQYLKITPVMEEPDSSSSQAYLDDELLKVIIAVIEGLLFFLWTSGAILTIIATRLEHAFREAFALQLGSQKFIEEHIKLNFGQAIEGGITRAPRDVGYFGRINPTRTRFMIDPMQPRTAAGGSQQFTVSPSVAGLTWAVTGLPGQNGDVGTISATGLYRAPAASAIDGRFVRVRVTATEGASGHHSSALVTVLVNELTINPLIQLCDYAHSVELAAGGLGPGQLQWAIKNPVPGESGRVERSEEPDGDHRYVAGPKVTGKTYVLDEIEVSNLATGAKRSAWVLAIQKASYVLIKPVKETGLPLPPGYIRLQAEYDEKVEVAEWSLPMGGPGSIGLDDDHNYGLYRADPAAGARFVLIFAVVDTGSRKFEGHIILPLPLDGFPAELELMTA